MINKLPETVWGNLYDEEPDPYVTTEEALFRHWMDSWDYMPREQCSYEWFGKFIESCKAGNGRYRGRKIELLVLEVEGQEESFTEKFTIA